jgi:hypothetical protein
VGKEGGERGKRECGSMVLMFRFISLIFYGEKEEYTKRWLHCLAAWNNPKMTRDISSSRTSSAAAAVSVLIIIEK